MMGVVRFYFYVSGAIGLLLMTLIMVNQLSML